MSASGSVAAYARGREYHRRLRKRMIRICHRLEEFVGRPVETRCCIDIIPLMERDLAMRAGLGWIGKNTLLLHPRRGSYMFLAEILIALDLPADPPMTDHCGNCTACLDACPTGAFPAPRVLDARKCISYLTIERHGPLAEDDRPLLGAHVYGCDICQDVCPFNRKSPQTELPAFREPLTEVRTVTELIELVTLSEEAFFARFAGTALMRAKRQGVVRNAAIALGNIGDPAAIPALQLAADDADPVVADAARWALGRLRQVRTV